MGVTSMRTTVKPKAKKEKIIISATVDARTDNREGFGSVKVYVKSTINEPWFKLTTDEKGNLVHGLVVELTEFFKRLPGGSEMNTSEVVAPDRMRDLLAAETKLANAPHALTCKFGQSSGTVPCACDCWKADL